MIFAMYFKNLFSVISLIPIMFMQFKKREKHHGGVLLFVKLQVPTESSSTPREFFTFLKFYECYQIAQRTAIA